MTEQQKFEYAQLIKNAIETKYVGILDIATKQLVDTKIAEAVSLLKDGVDTDHDTLKELADAIVAQAQQATPMKKFFNTPVVYQTGSGNNWTFKALEFDDSTLNNDGTTMADYSEIYFLLFITSDIVDEGVRVKSNLSGVQEVSNDEPVYAHRIAILDKDTYDYAYATAGSLKKGDMCIAYYQDGDDDLGGTNTFFIDEIVRIDSGDTDEGVTVDDLENSLQASDELYLYELNGDYANSSDNSDWAIVAPTENNAVFNNDSSLVLSNNMTDLFISLQDNADGTTHEAISSEKGSYIIKAKIELQVEDPSSLVLSLNSYFNGDEAGNSSIKITAWYDTNSSSFKSNVILYTGDGENISLNDVVPVNSYFSIAVTVDSTQISDGVMQGSLYINGNSVYSGDIAFTNDTQNETSLVFKDTCHSSIEDIQGTTPSVYIDRIGVFDRLLTDDEIGDI